MHPPGHGLERLQDRRRAGAGNYKSNPSSRGVKLQRKRTSKEGEEKKKKAYAQRFGGFPCAPGTQILESCKSNQKEAGKANKSSPPPQKRRMYSPARPESRGAATRLRRLWSPTEVRGAGRAAGERKGGRLDSGKDAAGEGAARGF